MTAGQGSKKGGHWKLFTDGASKGNPGQAGAGWVLVNPADETVLKEGKYLGEATNNEAEYQALILGLKKSLHSGVKEIVVHMDSELLVRQLKGIYKVRNPRMAVFYREVNDLLPKFEKYEIIHVPREQNREADAMANVAIRDRKNFS
jgi:ribonuclease HI